MTTTIQVNVRVTPAGPSSTNGVNWTLTGDVEDGGTINLNHVQTPPGDPTVDVVFALMGDEITWTEPPYVGTFHMRFYVHNRTALDAVLFGDGDQPKQAYYGSEFTSLGAGEGDQTVTVEDKDDDRNQHWNYGLVVFVHTGPGDQGIPFTKDPPWKNKD